MKYASYYTTEFRKQLKKYASLKKIIKRKIELLLDDPYRNCKGEPLHHQLKGLRSARLTKNIRVIFAICEEAKEYLQPFLVDTCKRLGGKSVIFVTLGVHEKVY